jgi:hypothetical protein
LLKIPSRSTTSIPPPALLFGAQPHWKLKSVAEISGEEAVAWEAVVLEEEEEKEEMR